MPHVTAAIMEWVERVSKIPVDGDEEEPEVCIIEVNKAACWVEYFVSFRLLA